MITPEEYINHNYNVIPCYENDEDQKARTGKTNQQS
jgi:hypothetical protein